MNRSVNDPLEDAIAKPPTAAGGPLMKPLMPETGFDEDEDDEALEFKDGDWVSLARGALDASMSYMDERLIKQWNRNYRMFRGKHIQGSKYESFKYRNRSKLFKPKTKMAVRKNNAAAAASMFSTEDVVSIKAERSSNRLHVLGARFIHEALNYRLDRANPKAGPEWFLTAMGARHDAQVNGVCYTKQYWEYEEALYTERVEIPLYDALGQPLIDPATGEQQYEVDVEDRSKVVTDRLAVDNIPPELMFIDFSADWRDPISKGGYLVVAYPTRREDALYMIESNASRAKMGGRKWRDLENAEALIDQATSSDAQRQTTRDAREGGDRYDTRHADKKGKIIWLYECFYRIDGMDYQWWMLGEHIMLSDPVPTVEAYPHLMDGQRPYVRGVGSLEPHVVVPDSMVQDVAPLQMEMNDLTNLRLDAQKMSISPITKIKRGRNIDFKQVQNRGPDAHIMVEEGDDVTFDRAPNPPNSTQMDMNTLATEFDEMAGVFSGSSVQTNRQLNETVGGMNLLSASSNSITEFDLRVWAETWAEPAVRQCCQLLQYYETDEVIIEVAGEKAGIIDRPEMRMSPESALDSRRDDPFEQMAPKFSIDQVMSEIENINLAVRVDMGIGSMDSRLRMEKFMGASKITLEMMPLLEKQGIEVDARELMQEVWGLSGYKDSARFFRLAKDEKKGPPPEIIIEQMRLKARMQEKQMELAAAKQKMEFEGGEKEKERVAKLRIEMMKILLEYEDLLLKGAEFDFNSMMESARSEVEQDNYLYERREIQSPQARAV